MEQSLLDRIAKYDFAGPRYTSYPPAPVFTDAFDAAAHRQSILETERSPRSPNVSLYFHIPFCDTLCYFCGCTAIITRNRHHFQEYVDVLKQEVSLVAPLLHKSRNVVQMHWGGGTPTYLTPSQIDALGGHIRNNFSLSPDAEVSVEVDPRDLTFFHLQALRGIGFNRISLGVQDFDPRVQRAVNRNQSEFVTRQAIEWSRGLGFSSLNLDLIYGLPLQTVQTFASTLEKVIDISPDRIAVYNFAYVPWMKKHQSLIHSEDMPSPETKLKILAMTIERLTSAGYVYIGMDHFAKPEDELTVAQRNNTLHRNFQGYSTNGGADLYGFGMSSISHYGTCYAQNEKTLPEYYAAIRAGGLATRVGYNMSFDDQVRKFVIMGLMCRPYLDVTEVEEKFGITFREYFAEALLKLGPLADDGLVVDGGSRIYVTGDGRLFLRNIAICFDAHTDMAKRRQQLYSRTV